MGDALFQRVILSVQNFYNGKNSVRVDGRNIHRACPVHAQGVSCIGRSGAPHGAGERAFRADVSGFCTLGKAGACGWRQADRPVRQRRSRREARTRQNRTPSIFAAFTTIHFDAGWGCPGGESSANQTNGATLIHQADTPFFCSLAFVKLPC